MNSQLAGLPTPSLVLDEARMLRNIARVREHLDALGVGLRPHLKTIKSVEAARRLWPGGELGPATVSTLREAAEFFAAGVRDITYAVGLAPAKLPRVLELRAAGCDLHVVLDSRAQAEAVVAASRGASSPLTAFIEIDTDGVRAGLRADDPELMAVGRTLSDGGAILRGVLTHAGGSYGEAGAGALAAFAERERSGAVEAADALRSAGLPCPVVSVGSTPTATFARDLAGVTEVRAGVFPFQDLVMAGLGVCTLDDIAISVLAAVIGHQRDKGWIIVDAGWTALSRDRGTASQAVDQGYGLVCDVEGRVLDDVIVQATSQEHGIIAAREGSRARIPDLPIGALVRILPNHACATAEQFDAYHVLPAGGGADLEYWPRFRGW